MKRRVVIVAAVLALFLLGGTAIHRRLPEPPVRGHHHSVAGDVLVNRAAGERVIFRSGSPDQDTGETVFDVTLQPGGAVPVWLQKVGIFWWPRHADHGLCLLLAPLLRVGEATQ